MNVIEMNTTKEGTTFSLNKKLDEIELKKFKKFEY
jgi:hypothetical protein